MELNRLPDELFHVLFGYLDVSTLLTNCALVCKRWRELIHQMRINELRFGYPSNYYSRSSYFTNFWGHPPVPLDPRYLVRTKRTSFFDFPFIKMFEHLKRLNLRWTLTSEFDFSKLNQFSALEELCASTEFREPTEKTLQLPRLRVLDLSFWALEQTKLTVDCPIKVLFIHSYAYEQTSGSLILAHPESLEQISLFRNAHVLNFSACKNVRFCRDYQYLSAYQPQGEVFTGDHLETFPNLEELHYQCQFDADVSEQSSLGESMNVVRSKISDALKQKKQQNRAVKIFFQGIQLKGEPFFESLTLNKMSDLPALQSEHYELLASNLYYYNKYDYSSFEKHFDDSLPADLFSRCTCVNTVAATDGVKHLNQFVTFLKQCEYLCELEVELDSVDQAFCDQLHVNCFFLKKLIFSDRKKVKSNESDDNPANLADDLANAVKSKLTITDGRATFKKFNFDFLAKQTNLIVFGVGEFDMDTALRCWLVCSSKLKCSSFYYFKGYVSITRSKTDELYSLNATIFKPRHSEFSMVSHKVSIDELALELEFFKKKIDRKLALESKV